MSLLMPDIGLLFWMLLSFGIVVFLLCRYGFPVILKSVEARKAYIDHSLETAREANEQLARIREESQGILSAAREEQAALVKEAIRTKEEVLEEARRQARAEGARELEKATLRIQEEREKAIREIRAEIAGLAVGVAEKIIREKMEHTDQQQAVVNRLLNEMTISKS